MRFNSLRKIQDDEEDHHFDFIFIFQGGGAGRVEGLSVRPQDRTRDAAEGDERRGENDWQRNWAASSVGVGGRLLYPHPPRPGRGGELWAGCISVGRGWGVLQKREAAAMMVVEPAPVGAP